MGTQEEDQVYGMVKGSIWIQECEDSVAPQEEVPVRFRAHRRTPNAGVEVK